MMKRNRKWFVLIELILASLVVICIVFMMQDKTIKKTKRVSVIVQNSASEQWTAFKYGIKLAAEDCNVKLSIVSTNEMLDVQEEKNLVEQEIKNGADAIILQPVMGEETEQLLAGYRKKIPIMLVESDISEEEHAVYPVTAPDNYAMGQALATAILEDYNGNLQNKTIGIYVQEDRFVSIRQREQGLKDGLKDSGVSVIWKLSDSFDSSLLCQQPKANIVVALDDQSVAIAGELAKDNNLHGAVVYGVGTSVKSFYYLGTGTIEDMVAPDDFDVGYHSLMEVSHKLENRFAKMKGREISYKVVNEKNLFTEENEKILFILNQ